LKYKVDFYALRQAIIKTKNALKVKNYWKEGGIIFIINTASSNKIISLLSKEFIKRPHSNFRKNAIANFFDNC